ncbi:unnamed protein product [Auanema sp. JU1783]|nr:unnamed protein product [Auanema sp. JU1783]
MHDDFSFSPNMVPLHRLFDEHDVDEAISSFYDELIQLSFRIKSPQQALKIYEFYQSKICRACGNTLDNPSNFFYHTFSLKHKTKVLKFVHMNDLIFWKKLMVNCEPLVPKTKKVTTPDEKYVGNRKYQTSDDLLNSNYTLNSYNNARQLTHSACQTVITFDTTENENLPDVISQQNPKFYDDQIDTSKRLDLELFKVKKSCLNLLMSRVDRKKLSRDMPWDTVVCRYCNVECVTAYHYIEHFLSTMHTIYIVSDGRVPKLEFFHFWETILLKNESSCIY